MAEEVVRVLRVDTGNSAKSINDIRKEIKSLRSELEKAAVGSEEFESSLKQLTQAQKSYNEIQQQVRDMSRTNQQDMVRFARFAQNLGKSYSALNAAIGLFADGNEDVQKAMLKVQRTIQLIQGLDGITGLIRDIPKVITAFKGWFNALDPVEKQVDRIAKGINGIDPKTLQAINEYNRNAGKTPTITTSASAQAGVGSQQIAVQNQELAKQAQTYYPALLKQEKDLYKAREAAAKKLNDTKASIEEIKQFTADYMNAMVNGATKAGISVGEMQKLLGMAKTDAAGVIRELSKMPGVNEAAREQLEAMGYDLNYIAKNGQTMSSQFADMSKELPKLEAEYSNLDKQYQQITTDIKNAELGMTKFQKVMARTGVVGRAAIMMIKTALVSIGIGLIIEGLVKAYQWIQEIIEASKEWQKINKEINQNTNQIGAKAVVVLKELAIAYAKVGDTAEAKQKFLKDYADKIKETGLAIDTVKEAEDVFVNNTEKYVQAIMSRAKAQAIENQAIKIYQDYLDERYDLEQKYEKDRLKQSGTNSKESYINLLVGSGSTMEEAEEAWNTAINKREKKIQDDIAKLDKKTQDRMKKMFEDIADLEKEYIPTITSLETTITVPKDTTNWAEEYDKALKALEKYAKDRLDILKDERTKELDAARDNYNDLVNQIQEAYKQGTKAAKGNADDELEIWNATIKALKLARETYEREKLDIIKKYNDQAFADEKAASDRSIQLVQTSIERLRKMSDTSNLRGPRQQNYETQYNQSGFTAALGLGKDWVNTYQSGTDIKAQYEEQVKYNNDLYNLTQERINGENKMLEEQKNLLTQRIQLLQGAYENTDINDLDGRKAILEEMGNAEFELWSTKQTIAENEIALNDALNENYEANTEAFVSMQEKRQQALNGTLSVASNLFGAMAQMAKTESQNQNKTEKEREDSLKAYKAFAVTQAIINTFQGANEAYTSMASIPYVGPALGIAAAVAAVAMGIANVHSILSESTNTSSTTSAAQTAPPTPMQTPPIEYTRQLIGDKELDDINKPIKCYVLEQDISNTQNKVRVAENNASF